MVFATSNIDLYINTDLFVKHWNPELNEIGFETILEFMEDRTSPENALRMEQLGNILYRDKIFTDFVNANDTILIMLDLASVQKLFIEQFRKIVYLCYDEYSPSRREMNLFAVISIMEGLCEGIKLQLGRLSKELDNYINDWRDKNAY